MIQPLGGPVLMGMLSTLDITREDAAAGQRPEPVGAAAPKQGRPVTADAATQSELSPPTVWLMAVRDQRDRSAFAQLFDHFAPRLTGMLIKSGMPRAAADDLVQDVMLTVWQKAGQFDPTRAQASAWIYRIARNRQIDVIRRERRPLPDELVHAEQDTEDDAAQALAFDQEAAKLREAIARLSPDQREIVEHAYMGDLTHVEIQQKTGLPLGTIKSRIRLGLERLRHELKDLR